MAVCSTGSTHCSSPLPSSSSMSSPSSADAPMRIALLGSTGSIGRQALDVIAALGEPYRVSAMAAGSGWAAFEEQVARWRPAAVSLADERARAALQLPDGTETVSGPDALAELATRADVDIVLV